MEGSGAGLHEVTGLGVERSAYARLGWKVVEVAADRLLVASNGWLAQF